MQNTLALRDGNVSNQRQSSPGQYYMPYPQSQYTDLNVEMFADAILNLDYQCLNYCHHRDPDWMDMALRFWEVRKALSVITPSARSYERFAKSEDVFLVWGVLTHVQASRPNTNRTLEKHLAAVMPVFKEEGLQKYLAMCSNGDLNHMNYKRPLFGLPNLGNQVAHFFHCIWGDGLDEYLPSLYQLNTALWDIQPDAMQYYFRDLSDQPTHETIVRDLKAEALRAFDKAQFMTSGLGALRYNG